MSGSAHGCEVGPILQAKLDAAAALAGIGTPEALDALIHALERTPETHSYMLADALATTGSATAVDALVRMARDHEDAQVRHGAIGALPGNIDRFADRREELFDVLESAIDDPDRLVRNSVAFRLRAEDPRVVDILIPALADQTTWCVGMPPTASSS